MKSRGVDMKSEARMDLTHPAFEVLGENRARVLRQLSLLAEGASGRSIHTLSGVKALRTTQQILDDLTKIGIVDVRRMGSANLYTLNREHILWPPIETILATPARTEQKIANLLEATLAGHARAILLYGSFARNEAGPHSDIDILIVWNNGIDEQLATELLDMAAQRVRRLTGNDAQLLGVTSTELEGLIARGDPIVDSLRVEARPLKAGVSIKQLLRGTT
jgi:predicted nucleotidyltransferase